MRGGIEIAFGAGGRNHQEAMAKEAIRYFMGLVFRFGMNKQRQENDLIRKLPCG
jgi:hypothetical protein